MNLKTIAAAALLATAAASSFANATVQEGDVTLAGGFTASDAVKGMFTDSFDFTLSGTNDASASITNAFTTNPIANFTVSLTNPLGVTTTFTDVTFTTGSKTAAATFTGLTAGDYVLTVSGIAGTKISRYGGDVDISPSAAVSAVPEPASVALMLAGLGCMGFVAKRRKQG